MNDTPGTTAQVAGLSGLPFALVVMGIIALVVAAIWCFAKKRRATATMLVGGALVLLYLLWSVWPVLLVAVILIVAGAVARLSIFARLRRAGSAALQAAREPVGDNPTPAAPPAATE